MDSQKVNDWNVSLILSQALASSWQHSCSSSTYYFPSLRLTEKSLSSQGANSVIHSDCTSWIISPFLNSVAIIVTKDPLGKVPSKIYGWKAVTPAFTIVYTWYEIITRILKITTAKRYWRDLIFMKKKKCFLTRPRESQDITLLCKVCWHWWTSISKAQIRLHSLRHSRPDLS